MFTGMDGSAGHVIFFQSQSTISTSKRPGDLSGRLKQICAPNWPVG
jgi:hypothetical protein